MKEHKVNTQEGSLNPYSKKCAAGSMGSILFGLQKWRMVTVFRAPEKYDKSDEEVLLNRRMCQWSRITSFYQSFSDSLHFVLIVKISYGELYTNYYK